MKSALSSILGSRGSNVECGGACRDVAREASLREVFSLLNRVFFLFQPSGRRFAGKSLMMSSGCLDKNGNAIADLHVVTALVKVQ
jgi:hypothetical protein